MTLDEAVELASYQVSGRASVDGQIQQRRADKLAQFILDTLDQQLPCGFDEPRVELRVSDIGMPGRPVVIHDGVTYDPDEAIALGAALVRAGLQAKGGG